MNRYFYFFLTCILVVVISVGFYVFNFFNPEKNQKNNNSEKIVKIKNLLEGKEFVWVNSELNFNKETITPIKKDAYSIKFESDFKVKISTDCNNGFGEYELKENKLKIGNITSTEKYCPDSQEGIFYNELISAENFNLDSNGNLVINFLIGDMFLKERNSFEQVKSAVINPLIGKEYSWLRTELKNNKVILPIMQGKFKLTFSEDMKFTLVTDCNTNGGMYVVNEKNLTFTEIIATRMYCEKSQEEVFIRDLQKTSSYEILPDETLILNMVDNSGRIYFR